jgi:L-amino acid N-acyltransferase YncA
LLDTGNSSDEAKRLHQTAQIEVLHFTVKREKQQKRSKRYADANTAAKKAFVFKQENSKPEPNPFSPKIEMYIRPAMEKDDQGIAKIYNEHAVGSIIPEDQERLDPSFAKHIVETLRDERLPFIVAVKGRMPSLNDAQGRSGPSKEANLPLSEAIIGFAFAERFNYGFAGGVKGRSRATLNLQLYVHPDHKKNYVGQNLLDRLMHLLTPARAFRNACDWLNPENNKIYEPGDSGRWHQVIFQIPTRKDPKDDPNIKWLSNFLYNKFHFKEEGCLPSVARSRPYGGQGKWLDLVIFQTEACHGDEWTGYQ